MERRDTLKDHIAGEAADWFARLHDRPDVPAADHDEFSQWLLRSPAHIEEYLAVTRLWGDVAGLDEVDLDDLIRQSRAGSDAPNVIAMTLSSSSPVLVGRGEGAGERSAARSRLLRPLAYAAGLAAIAATVWFAAPHWLQPSHLTTAIGEQRSFTLADGSMVYLNTNSELRIALTDRERRLVLERGEARFSVAKDPRRPFLVATPQTVVRAVGTTFNVQILHERTAVTVIEGRVALSENPARSSLELKAGEQAAVTQAGEILPDTGPGVERALAWTQRRLIFHEESLSAVVAEFNRYHPQPLRLADPALAVMKISGAFDATDPASLVEYLQRYEHVSAQPENGGGLILRRQ